jgi:hypothetical protein
MSVISSTLEVKIWKLTVQDQSKEKISKTPSQQQVRHGSVHFHPVKQAVKIGGSLPEARHRQKCETLSKKINKQKKWLGLWLKG